MLQKFFIFFKGERFLKYSKRLALFLLIVQFSYFCHIQTDGFTIRKIHSKLEYNPKFETSILEKEELENIQHILSQKFYYYGKGAQCYAFLSEDGKYILKFIRFPRLSVHPLLGYLPLPSSLKSFREKKEERMNGRLDRHFTSFKIAHDYLKKETGILFLHLNKTNFLNTKITLLDRLNIAHALQADGLEFILQKKAEMVYPALDQFVDTNQTDLAKQAIDSILNLFVKRCKEGVFDADPNLQTNFGLVGSQAVEFDIGRFCLDPNEKNPSVYLDEIHRITRDFSDWLKIKHPEINLYLEEQIAKLAVE